MQEEEEELEKELEGLGWHFGCRGGGSEWRWDVAEKSDTYTQAANSVWKVLIRLAATSP